MSLCPCCSKKEFSQCCEPIIKGDLLPETPEALMRSRYTSYVNGEIDYLRVSTHPDDREDFDSQSTRDWSEKSQWQKLEIINTTPSETHDNRETVEFKAHYQRDGGRMVHHELAEFRKSDGTWYFFDGKMVSTGQIRRDTPKVGRNDPCPCGSGKKFKKCCGA